MPDSGFPRVPSSVHPHLLVAAILSLWRLQAPSHDPAWRKRAPWRAASPTRFFAYISSTTDQPKALNEISSSCGATYVRFFVSWAQAEPTAPSDSAETLDPVHGGVASAINRHKPIGSGSSSLSRASQWASNHEVWIEVHCQAGNDRLLHHNHGHRVPRRFPELSARPSRPSSRARCTPTSAGTNRTSLSLYPQTTRRRPNFAAHLYVQMLRSFSRASGRATQALRVAGATAPTGSATPNAFTRPRNGSPR